MPSHPSVGKYPAFSSVKSHSPDRNHIIFQPFGTRNYVRHRLRSKSLGVKPGVGLKHDHAGSESMEIGEEIVRRARQVIAPLQETTLSSFKLLEALLDHSPTRTGREAIAQDIIAASELGERFQTAAVDLAEHYHTALLLPSTAFTIRV